jgi:hypothetical protein
MRDGPRRYGGRAATIALLGATAVLVLACGSAPAPSRGVDPATGFPLGAFSKEFMDPELGRMRIDWVFAADGRWAEVPFPLDGQPQRAPVVRGTYRVDGDALTVATEWPPGWGTSRHRWRLDGDDLWTSFESSDVAADADWFATLDTRPWQPAP